jgi:hypothetical protein
MPIAILIIGMHLSDILVIYLTFGSPLAVHYFFRTTEVTLYKRILRGTLAFLFWPTYAIWLISWVKMTKPDRTTNSLENSRLDAPYLKKVDALTAAMESVLRAELPDLSILEFREMIERYAGLVIAERSDKGQNLSALAVIDSADRERIELNAMCINRRNRKRLTRHRTLAGDEYFGLISDASGSAGKDSEFVKLSIELCRVISDNEMLSRIVELQRNTRQMPELKSVKTVELDVWPSQAPQHSNPSRI